MCRLWHDLSLPYLYDRVVLGRGRILGPLLGGLKRSRGRQENLGGLHFSGWWTRRLDIVIRDHKDSGNQFNDLIAQIIEELPNLSIVIFGIAKNGMQLAPRVLDAFSCTNANRLQAMHWMNGNYLPMDTNAWFKFLSRCKSLRYLDISDCRLSNIPSLIFPSVTTIYLRQNTFLGFMYYVQLPALNHIVIDLSSPIEPTGIKDFLKKNGHVAISAQVNCCAPHWLFGDILGSLDRFCTNLVVLEVLVSDWIFFKTLEFPRFVKKLVLRSGRDQAPGSVYTVLFDNLYLACIPGASLRTVVFPLKTNVSDLRRHPAALIKGLEKLAAIGVVVQDHEGQTLQ